MSLTFNTYKNWISLHHHAENKWYYQNNNYILYNVVKGLTYKNAFILHSEADPNYILKGDETTFGDKSIFQNCDVAEVLRGDYSKLFFDIDSNNFSDANIAIQQVSEMFKIIKKNYPKVKLIIFAESKFKNLNLNINSNFKIYHNPNISKILSAHVFICGVYFKRSDLRELFKNVNSIQKLKKSKFSKSFDFTILNTTGQKIFRHVLSGKAIKNRKPNPNIPDKDKIKILKDYKKYCATKTDKETELISDKSKCFKDLKKYIDDKHII